MFNLISIISILEVILLMLPILLVVAFVTVAERKTMASMQRRIGPNAVGYYGLLQAFADALKLIIKEYVAPTQANLILFFLGPMVTLFFSLLAFSVVSLGPFSWIADLEYGILFILAVSSVGTYGILIAGWSANSKFAFLGSIRSTAQLISYELAISSVIILVILISRSLSLNVNVLLQKIVWFSLPIFPVLLIFFIAAVAETNRGPFDLAEAESELVSGFMTEHSAVIFVFFFLAEYASILLMCILTSTLFLGGYKLDLTWITDIYMSIAYYIDFDYWLKLSIIRAVSPESFSLFRGYEGIISGIVIGIKTSALVYLFIWVRASLPRIRFDQLMSFCWTVLLPILFAFIILFPCVLYSFDCIICDFSLLIIPDNSTGDSDSDPLELGNEERLEKFEPFKERKAPISRMRFPRPQLDEWQPRRERHDVNPVSAELLNNTKENSDSSDDEKLSESLANLINISINTENRGESGYKKLSESLAEFLNSMEEKSDKSDNKLLSDSSANLINNDTKENSDNNNNKSLLESESSQDLVDNNDHTNNSKEEFTESLNTNFSKRKRENDLDEESKKKVKSSAIDYVLEQKSCEMPDIYESDGGD